jgi:hypothetical protein
MGILSKDADAAWATRTRSFVAETASPGTPDLVVHLDSWFGTWVCLSITSDSLISTARPLISDETGCYQEASGRRQKGGWINQEKADGSAAGALRSPKPATAIPSATVEYTTRHPPDFEGDRCVGADDSKSLSCRANIAIHSSL